MLLTTTLRCHIEDDFDMIGCDCVTQQSERNAVFVSGHVLDTLTCDLSHPPPDRTLHDLSKWLALVWIIESMRDLYYPHHLNGPFSMSQPHTMPLC